MYSEAKKLHIIEEVLKIDNESTLTAIEFFLKTTQKHVSLDQNSGFTEFSGIWSKDEAEEIEKIIEDSCETIDPNDWK